MKKSFSYPIIFMALITAIFTFVLAFLNYSTAEKIAFLQDTELRKNILYIFDINIPSNDPEDIDRVFTENIKEEEIDGDTVFIREEDGDIYGYAIPVGGAGLWGSIEGYVGLSSDYSEILGLEFTEHSETPGLGGRISEEEFKGQFRNLDISEANANDYIIYRPAAEGNVDAITGATLTSKSVSDFLNEDIYKFIQKRKGE